MQGSLADLSVVDLLQFIHLGGRSGTLTLWGEQVRGRVTFHRGRIVGAQGPTTRRLGDVLVEDGVIDQAALESALAQQRSETPARNLGRILVERGLLAEPELRRRVEAQVEQTVYDLVTWRRGRFEFEMDELRLADDIAVDPGELLLQVDLNTQALLLEAMRIFDEQGRGAPRATPGAKGSGTAAAVVAGAPPPVVLGGARPSVALAAAAISSAATAAAPAVLARVAAAAAAAAVVGDAKAGPARPVTAAAAASARASSVTWSPDSGESPDEPTPEAPVAPAAAAARLVALVAPVAPAAAATSAVELAMASGNSDSGVMVTTAPPRRLQVVSTVATEISRMLKLALPAGRAVVVPVTLRDAGSPMPGEPAPVVLLDVRGGGGGVAAIAQLRRTRPRSPILAIAETGEATRASYEAGASAVLPADAQVIAAGYLSVVRQQQDFGADVTGAGIKSGLAKLRSVLADLRSGLLSATVSLSLMNIIADSVERAVLFMLRRDRLLALGAFGVAADGRSLADATSSLTLPLDDAGSLVLAARDGGARSFSFDSVPAALATILGKPLTGQCAAFPVQGTERVIALVYADNGRRPRAIEQVEMLELAATHVGVSFENELLRRRLKSQST